MRIVHLVPTGYFSGWGYQENDLVRASAKASLDEIVVIAGSFNKKLEGSEYLPNTQEHADGARVIRLAYSFGQNTLGKRLGKIKGLFSKLEEISPDLIICHSIQNLSICDVTRFAKKHSVRVVGINHADYQNSARNWFSKNIVHKLLWKPIIRSFAKCAIRLYGVLPRRCSFLKEMYGVPETLVSYLPVGASDEFLLAANLQKSRETVRQRIGATQSTVVLLTGGRFDKYKSSVINLASAIKELGEEGVDVKLVIFGQITGDSDALQKIIDQKTVFFEGWKSDKESYQLMAAADMASFTYLHSTLWEKCIGAGLPLILLNRFKEVVPFSKTSVCWMEDTKIEAFKDTLFRLINDPHELDVLRQSAQKDAPRFLYSGIWKSLLTDAFAGLSEG